MIGTNYWYKIDTQKCNDVSSNDYYYSANNCWETYNLPWLVKLTMFIILTIIPIIILLAIIIIYPFNL